VLEEDEQCVIITVTKLTVHVVLSLTQKYHDTGSKSLKTEIDKALLLARRGNKIMSAYAIFTITTCTDV